MSKIYSALRALELEQREQQESEIRSKLQVVASTVDAEEFSALKEFTAPRKLKFERGDERASTNPRQTEQEALGEGADDFAALEERVVRVAELVTQERQGRMAAEERALHAEEQVSEQAARIRGLEREMDALKSERANRRERAEQMMALLDSVQL